ncbi:hypothetical protein BP6252_07904 [Coleophoma cylindrospora]|uniref:PHD-type domain-containing protein n=1 Tax=Coleophoma cylindrospora TaxID=1849047 RepID=A0A3D8RBT8_9HELO|nr:hypothetical protein BP6252_07904 [Coleophoma cylindrospora]
MSWDPAYGFGNPNAQPPTPTKTPTAAAFPSPSFQTPLQTTLFDNNRSGWTPTFAEEYSVFNATPGRLTAHSVFAEAPRPQSAGGRRLASTEDLAKNLASHIHHLSPGLPPPISPADQLPSSVDTDFSSSRFNETLSNKIAVTPQKPKQRLDDAFSGQTATPPHSASKGSRRLAPKLAAGTMQRHDPRDTQFGESGTPTPQHMMPFSSADMFGYHMSMPATAPAFNTKPFWDPDTSMSGMDMDFSHDSAAFIATSHKPSNSNGWGRNSQAFEGRVNVQSALEAQRPKRPQSAQHQRPLAPKASTPSNTQGPTLALFDFNASHAVEDPFAVSNVGSAVDPGLLFSRPTSSTTDDGRSREFGDVMMPPARPATSQLILEPYQHQLRESRRDQEELRRSRSTRENGSFHFDRSRGTTSSPVRGSFRPGLQRSMSENKGKKSGKRHGLPISRTRDDRPSSRTGRSSPLKQSQYASLSAIPESPDRRPRTEVKLIIDGNGKARTETVVVSTEPKTKQRRNFTGHSDGWPSSPNESSSDDEPILIPSQNNSFVLPPHRNGPILSSYNIPDGRRSSGSGSSSYNQSESSREPASRLDGHESEAETVLDEEDGTGDATKELRKVMEGRKQTRSQQGRNAQHHRYAPDLSTGPRYAYGSSTTSPATLTDMDGLTPSSTRSGITRCVCNNADGDGFMIQWYDMNCPPKRLSTC